MSNKSKFTLGLPRQGAAVPPPPPVGAPPEVQQGEQSNPFVEFPDTLAAYPLPWIVGPYGDVWVAADVEIVDPEKIASVELVDGKWRATCARPRRVCEPADKGIAPLIVALANSLQG
jgi:hypothetical protein